MFKILILTDEWYADWDKYALHLYKNVSYKFVKQDFRAIVAENQ